MNTPKLTAGQQAVLDAFSNAIGAAPTTHPQTEAAASLEIARLNRIIAEKDARIAELTGEIARQDRRIAELQGHDVD
jgi:hypothetical protein